jgi:hypothetical protein
MRPRSSIRTFLISSLLAALASVGIACGDDQDPEGAVDLLERLRAADYQGWQRAPGYPDRRVSSAPHGDQVEIFVNDVVAQALAGGQELDAWPLGSIIAKDGYDDDGTLVLIAAMEKLEDGWYWAEWDADTDESIYSGKPSTCIDCHASGADEVRAFDLP